MNNKNIADIAGILDGLRGYFYPHEWGEWDYIGSVSETSTGTYELYSCDDIKLYLYGFTVAVDNSGGASVCDIRIDFDIDGGGSYPLGRQYVLDGECGGHDIWFPMPNILSQDGDIDVTVAGAVDEIVVYGYGYIET